MALETGKEAQGPSITKSRSGQTVILWTLRLHRLHRHHQLLVRQDEIQEFWVSIMDPIAEDASLYLVGFRIEPEIFDVQMYTIYVDGDRPIMRKGFPILFPRPELAASALSKSDCGASEIGPAPTELHYVWDITAAVYTLKEKDEAPSSELLNFLNVILDIF